jgi:DNA-binding GntR family transcriptional regulator
MINKDTGIAIEQPTPIRKQVYSHLRDQILNHSIESNSRLVESQIAKTLGISRTPIREALHLLEKDGFIESIPRVGYQVKKMALEELDEIFEIRKVNELLACNWLIDRMDAAGISCLESNLEATSHIIKNGNPSAFINLDEEFHDTLVEAAGSKHLLALCRQLRRLMLRYRTESVKHMHSVQQALEGHSRILDCIKNKDQTGLSSTLVEHLSYARDDIYNYALKRGEIRKVKKA